MRGLKDIKSTVVTGWSRTNNADQEKLDKSSRECKDT